MVYAGYKIGDGVVPTLMSQFRYLRKLWIPWTTSALAIINDFECANLRSRG